MGMGGDTNGCGACSKYCLFAVNFVVFVSFNLKKKKNVSSNLSGGVELKQMFD